MLGERQRRVWIGAHLVQRARLQAAAPIVCHLHTGDDTRARLRHESCAWRPALADSSQQTTHQAKPLGDSSGVLVNVGTRERSGRRVGRCRMTARGEEQPSRHRHQPPGRGE